MLKYDEVVIGHSLAAIAYAYLTEAVLINNGNELSEPFLFDFFEPDFDLSAFMVSPVEYSMTTNDQKTKQVGFSKHSLWGQVSYALSVAGKLPLSNKVSALRINSSEKVITAITTGNVAVDYKYEKLRVFNNDNIQGLYSIDSTGTQTFRVLDWYNVRTGCCHVYDHLFDNDLLAQEIYFYPSPRMGTKNHSAKDLVAVSYLTKKQLHDIEYSDVAVRFKVLNMMKAAGIRGARNGRDVKNPTRYKYYAVRIESTDRQVIPIADESKPPARTEFLFDSRTVEEVILQQDFKENNCSKTLCHLLKNKI